MSSPPKSAINAIRSALRPSAAETAVKRYSRGTILRYVRAHQPVSRSRIAQLARLTQAAVSRITQELIDAGLVLEGPSLAPTAKPGRPFIGLELAPRGAYVLGLGLEVSRQCLVLASLTGEPLLERDVKVSSLKDADSLIAAVAKQVPELLKAARARRGRVIGMGVATIGVVDPVHGIVLRSPFLAWGRVELGSQLSTALRFPVAVDSLLNAINLSEIRNGVICRGRNVLFVHATLAIGASLYFEDALIRGGSYGAGQIGHIRIAGGDRQCACGRKGCLNTVASGHAILADLQQGSGDYLPDESPAAMTHRLIEVLRRGTQGDPLVRGATYRAGSALGGVLAAICSALNPDCLILGGALGRDANYAQGIKDTIAASAFFPPGHKMNIVTSHMRADQAAVFLALDRFAFSSHLDSLLSHFIGTARTGS